jgi:hypothetical protein
MFLLRALEIKTVRSSTQNASQIFKAVVKFWFLVVISVLSYKSARGRVSCIVQQFIMQQWKFCTRLYSTMC